MSFFCMHIMNCQSMIARPCSMAYCIRPRFKTAILFHLASSRRSSGVPGRYRRTGPPLAPLGASPRQRFRIEALNVLHGAGREGLLAEIDCSAAG